MSARATRTRPGLRFHSLLGLLDVAKAVREAAYDIVQPCVRKP